MSGQSVPIDQRRQLFEKAGDVLTLAGRTPQADQVVPELRIALKGVGFALPDSHDLDGDRMYVEEVRWPTGPSETVTMVHTGKVEGSNDVFRPRRSFLLTPHAALEVIRNGMRPMTPTDAAECMRVFSAVQYQQIRQAHGVVRLVQE